MPLSVFIEFVNPFVLLATYSLFHRARLVLQNFTSVFFMLNRQMFSIFSCLLPLEVFQHSVMKARQRDTRHTSPSASIDDAVSKYLTFIILTILTNIVKIQPQWLIVFGDGKIITAKADEVISSAINERLYGEQVENFGTRALSEAAISVGNEKMTLAEGEERIAAIIRQLNSNGENSDKLKDFLKKERQNLSKSNVR